MNLNGLKAALVGGVSMLAFAVQAHAAQFDIPSGELRAALNTYAQQSGIQLVVSGAAIAGIHTRGVKGELPVEVALARILAGTGMEARREESAVAIVPATATENAPAQKHVELADAAPVRAASSVETVVVTSSKIKGDIQTVPIAITALSQEQLTARQIAGGPDLVKEVPNLTFSKTNFTGYNVQIRGIGTQAISVTTDPAVAVALNDIPFIRNHFFEQEFYDVSQVEVLRGPQGTLYGRNATAGVVNVISAKPTDQFEAMLSADWGNYHNRRYEGMVNVPIVDDRLDLRVAGEWTKRDGYSFDETTGKPIDGRDLWSTRVTLGFRPVNSLHAEIVWEHFGENDDRMRTAKQLCEKDTGPSSVGSVTNIDQFGDAWLSQGCKPVSLYSPQAFETPNGSSLPFVSALQTYLGGYSPNGHGLEPIDPYASTVQSRNLRVIQSDLTPTYNVKNDVVELNTDYAITDALTLTSQTGYNHDLLASTEDFNRFNTASGIFPTGTTPGPNIFDAPATPSGVYCDPQLGCSSKLVGEDLSREHAWQLSQEFRLSSQFSGPLNFSIGGNFLHYETVEDYFVFINLLTMATQATNQIGGNGDGLNNEAGDFTHCGSSRKPVLLITEDPETAGSNLGCVYIDPNPISAINGNGHNYFRSENPYIVNSYAGFGEVYYQPAPELKLTGGLRWTDDRKHFVDIPSWVLVSGWGYPVAEVLDQQWKKFSGRFVANWMPKLDFTDQSMFYASYARGYKGGGANPPGPAVGFATEASAATHPLTFKPEFNNAYEIGTKNTLGDGALTLDADAFYYDYKGYQISEIIDRTSININVDAKVKGFELESKWEPLPGLSFNFAGGYESSRIDNGQSSIDLMDRTAGHGGWMVVKPYIQETSNCVLPTSVVETLLSGFRANNGGDNATPVPGAFDGDASALILACFKAYTLGIDPGTWLGGIDPLGYPSGQSITTGFDPSAAPNGGAGFSKDLGGNNLPNTPHFTVSLGAQYSMPVSEDWAATLHGDFYWQSQSWARIFNDRPYDKIRGYSNVNLALILTGASGWQVMGYLKNVFNTTAVTGTFLNSDDTGLTTNVFLTDPRLFGVRVTKNW
jgi:iron complex outermembrane recepter protein